jgi:hypothetical protein
MCKKMIKHGIAIIGVAILIFLSVASATGDAMKLDDSAKNHYENKEYDEAIADYTEAIRLDAKSPYRYVRRGNAYLAKGDYDNAIADYDLSIQLRPMTPSFSDLYNTRGLAYEQKGDNDKAIADFEIAVRLTPESWVQYNIYRNNLERLRQGPAITQALNALTSPGRSINSVEALAEYLRSQPANSPDRPIKVDVNVNDLMLKGIADTIKSSGKYVNLNLSGSSIKEIPRQAFFGCTPLAGIIIPNSVTIIGNLAFEGCTSLTVVIIGNGVTKIEGSAFGCDNLTIVTFQGTIPENNFGDRVSVGGLALYVSPFPDKENVDMSDLRRKFYATDDKNGTPGTYFRSKGSSRWWKL